MLQLTCVYIKSDVLAVYVRRVTYKRHALGGYLRTFVVTNHTVHDSTACTCS